MTRATGGGAAALGALKRGVTRSLSSDGSNFGHRNNGRAPRRGVARSVSTDGSMTPPGAVRRVRAVRVKSSGTGGLGKRPLNRTLSGGLASMASAALGMNNNSRDVMAAMAAEEPANIFASDMVSTESILNRLREIGQNPEVVRLEIEDLLVNINRDKIIPVVKELLLAGDREWVSITFTDSLDDSDELKTWLERKRDIMADIKETVAQASSALDLKVLTFQVKIDVRAETSLKSFASLLQLIKLQRGVCGLDFGGALFGCNSESIKKALADNVNTEGSLSGLIQVQVSCGWGADDDYMVMLKALLRAVNQVLKGKSQVEQEGPALRRVMSASTATSLAKAGARNNKRAVSPMSRSRRERTSRSPSSLSQSPPRTPERSSRPPPSPSLSPSIASRSLSPLKTPERSSRSGSNSSLSSLKATKSNASNSSMTLKPPPDFDWEAMRRKQEAAFESDTSSTSSSGSSSSGSCDSSDSDSSLLDDSSESGSGFLGKFCASGSSADLLDYASANRRRPAGNPSSLDSLRDFDEMSVAHEATAITLTASVDNSVGKSKKSHRTKDVKRNKPRELSPQRISNSRTSLAA